MERRVQIVGICILIVLVALQVHPALAETTPEQFMAQIEGKIDFDSYPRIGQSAGWARDTYYMQYYDKDAKCLIKLVLTDDYVAKDVTFQQYGNEVGTISDSLANNALEQLRYVSAIMPTPNKPPVCSFTYTPPSPYIGEVMEFKAQTSYDPDGTIVSYTWDFGDGETAEGIVVHHSYANPGSYTVRLSVIDDREAENSTSSSFSVTELLNKPPISLFVYMPTSPKVGECVEFDARASYDPDGNIVSYTWDFGDGETAEGIVVHHSYANPGSYTVRLSVIDDKDAKSSTSSSFSITPPNKPPISLFVYMPTSPKVGEYVEFDARASHDPDGTIVSYTWDFGDGETAEGIIAHHSYAYPGSYTVRLSVIDDRESESSTSSSIPVVALPNTPPVSSFKYTPTSPNVGECVEFDARASHDPDGTIVSYTWDFGDGETANGLNVRHVFPEQGTYTVTLTVTDNREAKSSTSSSIPVIPIQAPPPMPFLFTLIFVSIALANVGWRMYIYGMEKPKRFFLFRVDYDNFEELESSFKRGIIPKKVRDRFREKGFALSDDATPSKKVNELRRRRSKDKRRNEWELKDRKGWIYLRESDGKLDVYVQANKFLFSAPQEFEPDLKEGSITRRLRDEFREEGGVSLSNNAIVTSG
jgi:PKD repeat protein